MTVVSETICALCGEPLGQAVVYYRVAGWERDRKAGGTNALRCRERTGEVAHRMCVDRAAHGLSPLQGTLL